MIAENEPQNAKLALPANEGGYGIDGLWNDDFHHTSRVALTGKTEAYYTDYLGTPQELISALKWDTCFRASITDGRKKGAALPPSGSIPRPSYCSWRTTTRSQIRRAANAFTN